MPEPRSDESRDDFINRCMGDDEANSTFPDNDQRYAFCVSQFENKEVKNMDKKEKKYMDFSAKIKAEDEEKRVITAIGSSSNVDRDKEIVNVKGLDINKYKENPVLLWAHKHDSLPIGRAIKISKTKDGELKFELEFADAETNPFADTVYRLYKGGFLNAFSIGFLPDYKSVEYDEKSGVVTINKSELLELSAVPVPANSDARVITRSFINEAVKVSVIDAAEAKDFEITLKDEYGIDLTENAEQITDQDDVSTKDPDQITILLKKIESLEARIKTLESLNTDEEEDSNDYFDELFKSVSDEESIETASEEDKLISDMLAKYTD